MDDVRLNIEPDVKDNLLHLMEKKMVSLQIAARCHERLAGNYRVGNKIVNYSSIVIGGINVVMSALWGTSSSSMNMPLVVTTGIAIVLKGIQHYGDLSKKAEAHRSAWNSAIDMADGIEYVMLKNNHTVESLQRELDTYEERIKGFRKTEEPIPMRIKLATAAQMRHHEN